MNTIEQQIRSRLEAMGLQGERLDACMVYVKTVNPTSRWNNSASEYSLAFKDILFASIKSIVIEWLVKELGKPVEGEKKC